MECPFADEIEKLRAEVKSLTEKLAYVTDNRKYWKKLSMEESQAMERWCQAEQKKICKMLGVKEEGHLQSCLDKLYEEYRSMKEARKGK